jgi:hypothetical protein
MPEPQVVPIHVTILPWQKTMLDDMATEHGMLGLSETVRRVLTEYRNWKASVGTLDREAPAVAAAFRGEPACGDGNEED